jgi:hypothetical protein
MYIGIFIAICLFLSRNELLSPSKPPTITSSFTETATLFPTYTPRSTSSPTATPTKTTPTYTIPSSHLSDCVEQNGYFLCALRIEDPANPKRLYDPYGFYEFTPGYKLVAVLIRLGNISRSEFITFLPVCVFLVDNKNSIYQGELYGRDGSLFPQGLDLEAGQSEEGWIYFTVPENAIPRYIKYQVEGDEYLVTGVTH